jgi:hypothetical protein
MHKSTRSGFKTFAQCLDETIKQAERESLHRKYSERTPEDEETRRRRLQVEYFGL